MCVCIITQGIINLKFGGLELYNCYDNFIRYEYVWMDFILMIALLSAIKILFDCKCGFVK